MNNRHQLMIAAGLAACTLAPAAIAKDRVVAVFPEHFPPIFEVSTSGVPSGFGIALLEEVAAHAGLQVEYQSAPDWDQAFARLRSGEADLIPNLGITESRRQFADFSRPVESQTLRLIVRRHRGAPASLEAFRGSRLTVGVVKHNVAVGVLERQGEIRSHVYAQLSDALIGLLRGEIDGLVYPEQVVRELAIRTGLQDEIRAVGNPVATVERAIAVRKGDTELLERIDTALAGTMSSPAYRRIYAHWYPEAPPFWTVSRLAYLALILLVATTATLVYLRIRVLNRVNRQLEQAKGTTEAVLNASLEGILTLDRQGIILTANPAAEEIFQRPARDMRGRSLGLLLPQGAVAQLLRRLHPDVSTSSNDDRFTEYLARRHNGEAFPVRMGVATARFGDDSILVCTVQDVSHQREAERRASYYSDHDPLTGLLNQRGVVLVLENLLAQALRHQRPLICLNLGIDRLGHINDVYGRQVGDTVLVTLAQQLRDTLRNSDALARQSSGWLARPGGDRFLVVLPETDIDGGRVAIKRLLDAVEKTPFTVGDGSIHVSCRAGLAACPQHGSTAAVLLSHAESALRLAKQDGGDPLRVFSLEDKAAEQVIEEWVDRIRNGLRENRFELQFQPIMHIASGETHHYESLVRYRGGDGNLVSPNEFIPIAERFGLINRLDMRVLELAVSHLAGIESRGLDIGLSINVSGAHINDNALFGQLVSIIEEQEVKPENLILEITETAALSDMLHARKFVDAVQALGCRVALDDFGVGFSSFSHLRSLPVDIVKIDGSFVRNLPSSREDQALVRALTDVAHSLGKLVIAEFVASAEILNIIEDYGIDYAQGFHIGKPGPLNG